MQAKHLAVVPVGKLKDDEIEPAVARAAKVLRRAFELKEALPVPAGIEERERGQFRAALLLERLRASFARLPPGRMIGADDPGAKPPARADAIMFITDVDLYTASSEAVFSALLTAKGTAVVSVRRLREAFYRRPADANKQRARLAKEMARLAARLDGAPACKNPRCVLSSSEMLADLDIKEEKLCRACSERLFRGTVRI